MVDNKFIKKDRGHGWHLFFLSFPYISRSVNFPFPPDERSLLFPQKPLTNGKLLYYVIYAILETIWGKRG